MLNSLLKKEKKKSRWAQEVSRDLLALGGIPFYFIVIVRAIIGRFDPFIAQLVIAFIGASVGAGILRWCKLSPNTYLARGLILATFTSFFYKEPLFTTFAFILWALMIPAVYMTIQENATNKKHQKKTMGDIVIGILLGTISAAISYTLTPFIIS